MGLKMALLLAFCSFCWIEKRMKEKECSRLRVVKTSQRVREGTNFELTFVAFDSSDHTALSATKCFFEQYFFLQCFYTLICQVYRTLPTHTLCRAEDDEPETKVRKRDMIARLKN